MRFLLFLIVLLSEGIFSIKVIADTSTKRKTDMIDCEIQPQYCYDKEKNDKIGEFIPTIVPKSEPRVTTGIMHYRYEDGLVGKLKGNIPFIGVGLLTSYKKWVFDIYAQSSTINTNSNNQDVPFSKESNTEIFNTFQSRDIERDDYTMSLGYNLFDNINYRIADNLWLFLGYRGGRTAIDTTAIIFSEKLKDICKSCVTADEDRKAAKELNVDIRVKTHGPFIGTMIGKRIGDSQLGINIGFTRLTGKYHFDSEDKSKTISDSSQYGWTFGIDWNAPITNIHSRITLRYNFSLNAYQYDMNVKDTFFEKENLISDFLVKEQIYSFRAALLLQWW